MREKEREIYRKNKRDKRKRYGYVCVWERER